MILFNNVLDSMPTDIISLFPMPVKVEKRIGKLRRGFLWQGIREELVKWSIINVKKGGLGIKNLLVQNRSLLMKWHWRFNGEDNALWWKVINTQVWSRECAEFKMGPPPQGIGVQRNIRALQQSFSHNIGVKIGNGRKVSFQQDNWQGHSPFRDQFLTLYKF